MSSIWHWRAPSSFSGDFRDAVGGMLSFALKAPRVTNGGQRVPDLKTSGNGITLAIDAGPNPGLGWTPYGGSFTPGAWHLNSLAGHLATAADIQTVLSGVTSLGIRGDHSPLTHAATTGLDAVVIASAVPEPHSRALWLGGLLAIGSLAARRSRR